MFNSLKLSDFKSHGDLTININDKLTTIEGPNGSGKTSAGEALIWVLSGKDLSGDSSHKRLIKTGSDKMAVTLVTPKFSLQRSVTRKSSPTIKLKIKGWEKSATLPQSELESKLGMDFEKFSSIINVGWFMSNPPKRRRDILRKIIPMGDLRSAFNEITGKDAPDIKNITYQNQKKDLAAVTSMRLNSEKDLIATSSALKEQNDILLGSGDSSSDITSLIDERNKVEVHVNAIDDFIRRKTSYDVECRSFGNKEKEYSESRERMAQILKESEILKATPDAPSSLLKSLDKIKGGKPSGDLYALPAKPSFTDLPDGTCFTCGQPVSERTKVAFESRKSDQMAKFESQYAEVTQANIGLQQATVLWEGEVSKVEDSISMYHDRKHKANMSLESLRNEFGQLKKVSMSGMPEAPQTALNVEDRTALYDRMVDLDSTIKSQSQNKNRTDKSRARISELEEFYNKQEKLVKFYQWVESVFKMIPSFQLEKIKSMIGLEGYDLEILEKDGNSNGIEYSKSGVPYAYMSTGEKMKLDCQLSAKLSSLITRGDGSPLVQTFFIDNHELMDDTKIMDSLPGQRIITRVVKKDKLTIN